MWGVLKLYFKVLLTFPLLEEEWDLPLARKKMVGCTREKGIKTTHMPTYPMTELLMQSNLLTVMSEIGLF